jgi:hypothetical protein
MGRLLFFLLLLALAYFAWRVLRRAVPPPDAPPSFEPTARCAKCGTHVPRADVDAAGLCPRCRAG